MNRLIELLMTAAIAVAAAALCVLLATLPESADPLASRVAGSVPDSGVAHPVTAVLLNFRGYDTFLEMLVLLLAVLGVQGINPSLKAVPGEKPNTVLEQLLRFLVPLLTVIAVYLLWRGADAPGGAFQAGAVLGAAGVLALLAERDLRHRFPALGARMLLGAGIAAFAAVGGGLTLIGQGFLEYPPAQAKLLIFAIEALATLAIAATLVVLFAGTAAGD